MKQSIEEGDILYYISQNYNLEEVIVLSMHDEYDDNPLHNYIMAIFNEFDNTEYPFCIASIPYKYKGRIHTKYKAVYSTGRCFFKTKEEAMDDVTKELRITIDDSKNKINRIKAQCTEVKH